MIAYVVSLVLGQSGGDSDGERTLETAKTHTMDVFRRKRLKRHVTWRGWFGRLEASASHVRTMRLTKGHGCTRVHVYAKSLFIFYFYLFICVP